MSTQILPFMLGSGFLTAAIGEPLVTVGWPARPAGLGDPEAVRPGDSCNTETRARVWSRKPRRKMIQYKEETIHPPISKIPYLRDIKDRTRGRLG